LLRGVRGGLASFLVAKPFGASASADRPSVVRAGMLVAKTLRGFVLRWDHFVRAAPDGLTASLAAKLVGASLLVTLAVPVPRTECKHDRMQEDGHRRSPVTPLTRLCLWRPGSRSPSGLRPSSGRCRRSPVTPLTGICFARSCGLLVAEESALHRYQPPAGAACAPTRGDDRLCRSARAPRPGAGSLDRSAERKETSILQQLLKC
jgi:hypothetical protein